MRKLLSFALLFLAASAFSDDTVSIGFPFTSSNTLGDLTLATAQQTDIDLGNPASATGTISAVHYRWSQSGCTNAVKIKFFRRSGNTLTMTAERGPFTPTNDNIITFTPGVAVQQGDLIAITRLTVCGNAETFAVPTFLVPYVIFGTDVSGSVDISAGTSVSGKILALSGSGAISTESDSVKAIIPVVGSTAGVGGSNFKTALQMHINSSLGFVGKLVFHPQGASGSASDPSQAFSLSAGQTISVADIVSSMGQAGLGSIDVVAPAGMPPPVFLVRVFNDAGTAGTSGFIEDVVRVGTATPSRRVLNFGDVAYLITPADLTRFRLNVGVRSLAFGATITVTVKNSAGGTVRSTVKTYLPNFFQQVDAATFTGGPISADQSIQIEVSAGSLIVYGATTDNTTNDPAVQFAEVPIP